MSFFDWVRVVHVLAIILLIGGVSFVAIILLLPATTFESLEKRLRAFSLIERRFVWQARVMILLTGLSGLWMMHILGGWPWLIHAGHWWTHLMLFTWMIFAVLLFIVEPFGRGRLKTLIQHDPEAAWRRLRTIHVAIWVMLLITVICAVGGNHGVF